MTVPLSKGHAGDRFIYSSIYNAGEVPTKAPDQGSHRDGDICFLVRSRLGSVGLPLGCGGKGVRATPRSGANGVREPILT